MGEQTDPGGPDHAYTDTEMLRRAFSNRSLFEQLLDQFVSNNRFTIAVVFPITGAVLLLASAEGLLPELLAFNPYLVLCGVAVMRLPLVGGLVPLLDRRSAVALSALVAYAYLIEYVGVHTGLPYGWFHYEIPLGPMLLGTIPLGLPVFFIPLVLNSYLLAVLFFEGRMANPVVRTVGVAAMVVAIDLVLDPGAVALGFWEYEFRAVTLGSVTYIPVAQFYGVPLSNYAGWILSATVATLLIDIAFDREAVRERLDRCEYMLDDMVSFVLLWGLVNAVYGAWLPVAVAAGFGAGLLSVDRFDFVISPSFRST